MTFVEKVIDDLDHDRFLRPYREATCSFGYAMSLDGKDVSCAVGAEWTVEGYQFFVSLERRVHNVPLTFRERWKLTRAFSRAMTRLKRDRKAFLRGLRKL